MTLRKMTAKELAERDAQIREQQRWSRQADRRHAVRSGRIFILTLLLVAVVLFVLIRTGG